jgi:hypothetical protein
MTDPSGMQIPLNKSLTSDMMLGLKPTAPKSRSYRLSLPAMNKSVFTANDQIVFEIPTGRKGTWLDQTQSYLKFGVQCTTGTACSPGGSGVYIENTAYSFFQRQDIYHSSNLLESQNEVGQLANFLIDHSLSASQKAGLSTMIGSNPHYTYSSANTIPSISQTQVTAGIGANTLTYTYNPYSYVSGTPLAGGGATSGVFLTQSPGDRSGLSIATNQTFATSPVYNFTLPIISGVVGVNASKMLPLGKLGSPIRIELYTSANDDAIYYGSTGTGAIWQLVNVELELCYVEIDEDGFDPHQEIDYISTQSYRQTSATLPAAYGSEWTTLLPFRMYSLTALYARFRNQASAVQGVSGTAAYRKSSSINPNFSSYYARVGAAVYPNKPVYLINGLLSGSGAEAYAELLKSFHSLASITGDPAIRANEYNVAASAYANGQWNLAYIPSSKTLGNIDTFSNAFSIGMEFQTFSNKSDVICSGISTNNTQMFFTGVIASGLTAGGTNSYNYTVDFFAQYDMILVIEGGIMRAVF